jgi:predicted peroxiredoxin
MFAWMHFVHSLVAGQAKVVAGQVELKEQATKFERATVVAMAALSADFKSSLTVELESMKAVLKQGLDKVSLANKKNLQALSAQLEASSQLLQALQPRPSDDGALRASQELLAKVTALGASITHQQVMAKADLAAASATWQQQQARANSDLLNKLATSQQLMEGRLQTQLGDFKAEVKAGFEDMKAGFQDLKLALQGGIKQVPCLSLLVLFELPLRVSSGC